MNYGEKSPALWDAIKSEEKRQEDTIELIASENIVSDSVREASEYRASAAMLTDDCRQVLSSFGRATIVHCARESNGVAHWLARTSYRRKLNEVWQEHPPDFLIPSLVSDMIIL